jgi:hypothetical protein
MRNRRRRGPQGFVRAALHGVIPVPIGRPRGPRSTGVGFPRSTLRNCRLPSLTLWQPRRLASASLGSRLASSRTSPLAAVTGRRTRTLPLTAPPQRRARGERLASDGLTDENAVHDSRGRCGDHSTRHSEFRRAGKRCEQARRRGAPQGERGQATVPLSTSREPHGCASKGTCGRPIRDGNEAMERRPKEPCGPRRRRLRTDDEHAPSVPPSESSGCRISATGRVG